MTDMKYVRDSYASKGIGCEYVDGNVRTTTSEASYGRHCRKIPLDDENMDQ